MEKKELITIRDCRIEDGRQVLLQNVSWTMKTNEAWLLIGPNGGGKADFLAALTSGVSAGGSGSAGAGGSSGGAGYLAGGSKRFVPNAGASNNGTSAGSAGVSGTALYANVFDGSVEVVSLERAARLIQEERENDESEFIEGGVDIGRTGRVFIAEALCGKIKRNLETAASPKAALSELPEVARTLENLPEIKLCGVEKILDRGLKYMSTGEIRRTLLARALFSRKKLLVLSDPFAGLDVESRRILLEFFNTIARRQLGSQSGSAQANTAASWAAQANEGQAVKAPAAPEESALPRIILCMERYVEIPDSITHVLEFSKGEVSFCGERKDYEALLEKRKAENSGALEAERREFRKQVIEMSREVDRIMGVDDSVFVLNTCSAESGTGSGDGADSGTSGSSGNLSEKMQSVNLIEMHDVNVGWGETRVLRNLNWTLKKGEHWLIRGPNGSGKTTFLELITGDNPQVFCNDIKLFGARRGSGETIWDIKHRLGIVSYRLHVEYRMLGCSLREVIMSGFHDSIGLYQTPGEVELEAAEKWLKLGGFEGRGRESFNSLSYGEQRAILILRAAVKCPPVMILDEPCHGLDDSFREKILSLLEIIAESGTTTLLHVTHEESEVLACEHHVLQLLPGEDPMYRIETR